MYKYIFLILVFHFYSIELVAQKITILEKESGSPLEWVTIHDKAHKIILHSDVDGQCDLTPFSNVDTLIFTHTGYKTITCSLLDLKEKSYSLKMATSLHQLDQVVISATRWSQSGRDLPYKVSSLKSKDIAFQNPQNAADMLGFSGKVFIQKSQQGGGSPMIRGFSSNRLLYSIDGIRMNTAIFRSGNIQNVISLDAFAIENAEVFFGPGSVIYGSDAIGGVMSFQTWTPKFSQNEKMVLSGSTTARYSSANNEKTGHFHINIGSKRWAAVSSISYNDFGDLRMGSKGPDVYLKKLDVIRQGDKDVVVVTKDSLVQSPSAYSQLNLMQKISFKASEKLDLQYAFHYSATSSYARYDRHIRYKNGLPRYGEWDYGPQKWMMNQLNLLHNGNGKFYDQMAFRLAYQTFEESRIDRDINKPTRHIRTENVGAYSANLDFTKSINVKSKLNYGLEAVINDVKSKGIDEDIIKNTSVLGPSRYPQALWSSYAVFGSYEYKISDKINLQAGARYNYFTLVADYDTTFYPIPFVRSVNNNSALTGSLGVVYRPTESTAISGNLSTGLRAPNVDDTGKVFDSVDGFVTVPNASLRAEYAYNAELGLVQVFGDRIRLDASVYYTRLKDAMVRRPFQLDGQDSILYNGTLSKVEAIQNAAQATVKGVQLGIECKFGHGFSLTSSYNIQKGVEELDNGSVSPSRHAAPNYGTTSFTWNSKKISIAVSSVYSDGKSFNDLPEEEKNKPEIYAFDGDGKPYSPSWMIFNIKALYRLSHQISINAGLENIADVRYRPYSSGIAAAGRNLVVSASLKF
ncbi:MAG TPA: TonB-dependent receptor [Saprospiraceae bacterium]|nr:TonB-dependent receptor [Saprospiraceae bacterium]